jgi:uncharacterized membrane protein
MLTKTLGTVLILIVCIIVLPISIAVIGSVFGILMGVLGAVFGGIIGVFGAILGSIFGAVDWLFDGFFHCNVYMIGVIAIVVALAVRKYSNRN